MTDVRLITSAGTLSGWLRASLSSLPRYEVQRALPSHVGVSVEAYDTRLRRRVLLRVYGPQHQPQRALDGARAASRVRHPGVVEVHDAGVLGSEGTVYVAIEDLSGSTSLRAWLRRAPSRQEVAATFDRIARALDAAHEAGVVHGALEGTAARVFRDGRVVLIEFRGGEAGERDDIRALARLWLQATARWRNPRRERLLRSAASTRCPYASADALRVAVARVQRRSPWTLVTVGLAALAGVAVWTIRPEPAAAPCEVRVRDDLARAWGPDGAQRLQQGLASAGVSEETAARATELVDGYTQRWSQGATAACLDPNAGAQRACYAEARAELGAVVELLEHADARQADRALRTLSQLPELERCDRRVEGGTSDGIALELGHVQALERARRYEDAYETATRLLSEHPDLDDGSRARLHRVRLAGLVNRRDYDGATEEAEATFFLADKAGDHEVKVRVAARMVSVLGSEQRHAERATMWLARARAAAAESGDDRLLVARIDKAEASLAYGNGEYDRALVLIERAIEARSVTKGAGDPVVFSLRNNRANILQALGKPEEARAELETLLEARKQTLGTMNVDVARNYNNLGTTYIDTAQYDEGIAHLDRAIQIWEAVRGPEFPDLAMAYSNRGNAQAQLGRLDEALESQRLAIAVWTKAYGAEDFRVATARNNLAYTSLLAKRFGEAVDDATETIRVQTVLVGADHPENVRPSGTLAVAYKELGQLPEARHWADEALRLVRGREDTLPTEHLWARRCAAEVAVGEAEASDDPAIRQRATDELRDTCELIDSVSASIEQRAQCRVMLAQTMIAFDLEGVEQAAREAIALLDAGGAVRQTYQSARAELAARVAAP